MGCGSPRPVTWTTDSSRAARSCTTPSRTFPIYRYHVFIVDRNSDAASLDAATVVELLIRDLKEDSELHIRDGLRDRVTNYELGGANERE